jgi:hypothetical protein
MTYDPTTDPAFGTAGMSISGTSFSFSITQYLLGATTPSGTTNATGYTCSNGEITSTQSGSAVMGVTPSGVIAVDMGANGGAIGMLEPSADIGSTDILQQGREFRGFLFMTHPPNGSNGTPVDKTQALWATTLGDNLITAGEYTDSAGDTTEDTCPGGPSCATLSLQTEVAPGEFPGILTDSHAGSHPFTLMINKINGKYMVFGFSYNDEPDHPLLFLVMEQ